MKKIIITGATSGIGLEVGETFKNNGFDVINISRSKNDNFRNIQMDLSTIESVPKFIKTVEEENPEVVFLNSGMMINGFSGNIKEDEFIKMVNLNSLVPALIIDKLQNKNIKVVVNTSTAALITPAAQAAYGASKSFIHSFVQGLQAEQIHLNGKSNILEVIPAKLKATKIDGTKSVSTDDLNKLSSAANKIYSGIINNELTIKLYDNFYVDIFEKFHKDPIQEGVNSIEYRIKSGALKK